MLIAVSGFRGTTEVLGSILMVEFRDGNLTVEGVSLDFAKQIIAALSKGEVVGEGMPFDSESGVSDSARCPVQPADPVHVGGVADVHDGPVQDGTSGRPSPAPNTLLPADDLAEVPVSQLFTDEKRSRAQILKTLVSRFPKLSDAGIAALIAEDNHNLAKRMASNKPSLLRNIAKVREELSL